MYKFLIFLFFPPFILAQSLDDLNRIMLENYQKRNYVVSLEYGKKALDLTEEKFTKNSEQYLNALNTVVLIYYAMDSTDIALNILRNGLDLIRINNFPAVYEVMFISLIGSIYKHKENYPEAMNYYYRAVNLYDSSMYPKNDNYYNILKNLSECYTILQQYEKAEKYYLRCLDYLNGKSKIDTSELIEINGSLAYIYRSTAKFSLSEEYYLKTINLLRASNNFSPADYAYYINGLGNLYSTLNNFEKAEKLYNEAKEIRLRIYGDSSVEYAQSLNNLALLYDELGKYNESENIYNTVLLIWKKNYGIDSPIYALTLNNLATLYTKMGRYEEAIKLFNETLELRKKYYGEESISYANSLNNTAVVLKNMGYYDLSEQLLNKAIVLYKTKVDKSHPDYITAISNLASIYDIQGKYKQSEELYLQVLEIRKKILGANSLDYGKTLHNLGVLYFRNENYNDAEKYLTEAMEVEKKALGVKNPDYILTISNLARLKEVINKIAESKQLWLESLNLYKDRIHSIFPFLSENEKSKFYMTIKEKFEMFNSFVMRNYKSDPELLNHLIDFQLELKGLLLTSVSKMRTQIISSSDENLKSLYNSWISTKEELAILYNKKIDDKLLSQIDSLELLANQLEKKLSVSAEKYSIPYKECKYNIDSLKKKLNNDELAIDVIRFRYNYIKMTDSIIYSFIIISPQKKYPDVLFLCNGNDLEGRFYSDYINLIRNLISEKGSYKRYIEQLSPFLKDIKKIYFSPDGVYNKINLATLKKDDSIYPFRNINIHILTSLRDIFRPTSNKRTNLNAVLIGNPDFKTLEKDNIAPLPGTETEINNINSILTKMGIRTKIYLKNEANPENLKKIKNPWILHIATHGFFMEDIEVTPQNGLISNNTERIIKNPLLQSGLILSVSNDNTKDVSNNGIFTSYEAMNLDLDSTELVVLSACETGLGEVKNGEGVYGLQRSFIVAGARYIIMSLWKIDDEVTSELMISFYEKLSHNFNVKKAFNEAQFAISQKYKEPFYWGAFVILGY